MKNILLLISILSILISCDNKSNECLIELEEKNIEIDNLKNKIQELEDKLDKVESEKSHNTDYDINLNSLKEDKIALLEEELTLNKNRSLKKEVFFGMIENSDFENYIESYTYKNYQNPSLSKVYLNITGTEKIMDLYSHLYSQYRWLYIETNLK